MAKIKIVDLPKDAEISKEEMKKVFGGITTSIGSIGGLTQPKITVNYTLSAPSVINPGDVIGKVCCDGSSCACKC